jgi:hypothetical protein
MTLRARCFALLAGLALFAIAIESNAAGLGVLAEAQETQAENWFLWVIRVSGPFGLAIIVVDVALFLGACAVVFRSRRSASIACYLLFLPLPWILSLLAQRHALASALQVLERSRRAVEPSQIYPLLANLSLIPLDALLMTVPSYLVLAIGLFVRVARARPHVVAQGGAE